MIPTQHTANRRSSPFVCSHSLNCSVEKTETPQPSGVRSDVICLLCEAFWEGRSRKWYYLCQPLFWKYTFPECSSHSKMFIFSQVLVTVNDKQSKLPSPPLPVFVFPKAFWVVPNKVSNIITTPSREVKSTAYTVQLTIKINGMIQKCFLLIAELWLQAKCPPHPPPPPPLTKQK